MISKQIHSLSYSRSHYNNSRPHPFNPSIFNHHYRLTATKMSSIKPLTLHAHHTGPNPFKVAILLEALNIPYNVKLWQFGEGSNGLKGPNFLAINPNGRVPAL